MATALALALPHGEAADLDSVPVLPMAEFLEAVKSGIGHGGRIAALFGHPRPDGAVGLLAVLAHERAGELALVGTKADGAYPSLTPDCPEAHWFEREIAEQWGIQPEGHPWLKPIRFSPPRRAGRAGVPPQIGLADFFRLEGEEVHEVAVGPVHAGVIEPGHFRFQCHGERVYHLEISLGYQHRGVERALVGGPNRRTPHYVETLAGDTTAGHATAYAQTVEALAGARVSARAHTLRAIALELERLANHTGDLGALAGDVGYLPTASFCGRIRGDFLNLTALLCGSRFGRGLVRPGGVGFDLDAARATELAVRLDAAFADVTDAVELLWKTPSVMARFEDTGTVPIDVCRRLGLVGPAARACGVGRDVRTDFPTGIYSMALIPASTWNTGDVFARAYVRWLEIQQSVQFIREQVHALPAGAPLAEIGRLASWRVAVSLVEGWRGEICHVAITDLQGRFATYKVVDPSFHNWMGLALALRDQSISDFPLCNKSFNLSYCGHDL